MKKAKLKPEVLNLILIECTITTSHGLLFFILRFAQVKYEQARDFMDVSRVSLRRYSIVICMKVVCHARKVMHFTAQAQGFVKVTRLRRSHIRICSFRVVF